ncbi:50S ribosomal protein L23 [bacterium]|nr:50S ribosomal protein L23 [bacterium]
MKNPYDVLRNIVLTEQTTELAQKQHQYTFRVDGRVNKVEIAAAVEAAYNVKVAHVNTQVVKGKLRRRGRSVGRTSDWKKAVVVLAPGYTIDFGA